MEKGSSRGGVGRGWGRDDREGVDFKGPGVDGTHMTRVCDVVLSILSGLAFFGWERKKE